MISDDRLLKPFDDNSVHCFAKIPLGNFVKLLVLSCRVILISFGHWLFQYANLRRVFHRFSVYFARRFFVS